MKAQLGTDKVQTESKVITGTTTTTVRIAPRMNMGDSIKETMRASFNLRNKTIKMKDLTCKMMLSNSKGILNIQDSILQPISKMACGMMTLKRKSLHSAELLNVTSLLFKKI
jgi:hypothetical protein